MSRATRSGDEPVTQAAVGAAAAARAFLPAAACNRPPRSRGVDGARCLSDRVYFFGFASPVPRTTSNMFLQIACACRAVMAEPIPSIAEDSVV